MFDLVQKNKTAVQVVLGLVSLGLVVGFGIGGYSAFHDSEPYLAKVGSTLITERELAEAVGNRNVPDNMKPSLVAQLVSQQLLQEEARGLRMVATDESLRELIATIPAFQVDGKFDPKRYKELLANQQMTPEMFQARLKQDIVARQLIGGFSQAAIVSSAVQGRVEKMLGERREVQLAFLGADAFLKGMSVTDEEIKQYYDANQSEFKMPEMVKLEYLVLSQAALASGQQVSDAEIQKFFDENKEKIGKPLAEVKSQIKDLLKMQKSQAAFRDKAREFNEIVYQKADSLKPAAEAFNLQILKSDWVSRESAKERELSNPKIAEAVFSDDVLNKKHNSEAIEVSQGVMVAARVVEHKPEQVLPLADVSAKVADKLKMEKAVKKAQEDGVAKLKALQEGQGVNLAWSPAKALARAEAHGLDDEQIKAIFRVGTDKLPGYAGTEVKGKGYVFFKVAKVLPADQLPAEGKLQMADALAQMYGQVALDGYLEALRKQIKVEYKLAPSKSQEK
ncbi:PPIC-type PPIASE domain-containing protein [Formivibrio citricus]|uniref:PPIC-type PPIASE domain-containing protein n=1 Tax=Formivibrio citricus TaxID=83765 RepID=A0A1I4Y9N6_9NEIS|nr:SurA N-terminal domain-containing protein [Formivibrio citricus]SFN34299.1 PPIC-type PPIASE domain-containing protein [Formivibrio citricus]